jgi:membrane dipeptidase
MAGRRILMAAALALLAGRLLAAQPQGQQDLVTRARGIHERVITLDTHNDIDPQNFTRGCNYTMRLTNQVNLPKMKEGGLDVSFMIVYVGQSNPLQMADAFQPAGYDRAYKAASAKFDAVHHLTEEIAPNEIELALTAADVVRIAKSGKKVAVIGIENGYPVGTDLNRVKEFWQRGGRYMSLAHNGHNQLSDSNTDEVNGKWTWGGLSPLGRQVIQEMNKWGIMVDVSHPSKGSMMQAIGLSKAPVMASHSSVRKLANHTRNMDDEMLMAMKTNGGVVQMVALSGFVRTDPAERGPAVAALRQEFALPGGRGGGPGAGRGANPATPRPCPVDAPAPTGGPARP